MRLTESGLLRAPGFGVGCLTEVQDALARMGLELASPRQSFEVVLKAEPGIDGDRMLAQLLKVAARRFGLRAIRCEPAPEPGEAGR